jgi:membrane fusion protein (multidrug efflux system)
MDDGELFRSEALRSLDEQAGGGELLHLSPSWIRSAYWILVFFVVGALSFSWFATVGEWASGPAVVRLLGKTDLTATAAGTVASVEVRPGDHVQAGQLLVRFHVAAEQAELERLVGELEGQLVRLLRDPNDQAARTSMTALRAQKELAESRVAARSLKAPHAGLVSDVRIRPGQLLGQGDLALSLVGEEARFHVVAILPAQYRPLLRPGQPIALRLTGFPRALEHLEIASVADDVIGPAEAQRYLGRELGDTLAITGPIVLVEARLPSRTFITDDKSFNFYDGLPGMAEACVRSQRVLWAMVPALRALFGHDAT